MGIDAALSVALPWIFQAMPAVKSEPPHFSRKIRFSVDRVRDNVVFNRLQADLQGTAE